jgi:hypothetical protein
MSEVRTTPISSKPTNISSIVGAAAIVAGGTLLAITSSIKSACVDVYKKCKEGKYPVETLQIAYTPISNFDGFKDVLQTSGFEIVSSFENQDISFAVNPLTSENLFVINSPDGIGIISENKDLIQSLIQDFAIKEITSALQEMGFKVNIEEKGEEKVITALDKQNDFVEIKVNKEKAKIDTRKIKRPKCDIIQQLISQKIGQKSKKTKVKTQVKKKKKTGIHIRIKG